MIWNARSLGPDGTLLRGEYVADLIGGNLVVSSSDGRRISREERGHDIIPPPGQAEKGGIVPGEGGDRRVDVPLPPRKN